METNLAKAQAWFDIWALRGSKKETKYEPLIVVKISLKDVNILYMHYQPYLCGTNFFF